MQEKWGEIYQLLKAFYVPGIVRCLVYHSVLITTLQDAGLYSLSGHLEMLATCSDLTVHLTGKSAFDCNNSFTINFQL